MVKEPEGRRGSIEDRQRVAAAWRCVSGNKREHHSRASMRSTGRGEDHQRQDRWRHKPRTQHTHLRGGRISGMIEKFREKFPAPVLPLAREASPAGSEAPRFRRYCAGADMGLSGATKP